MRHAQGADSLPATPLISVCVPTFNRAGSLRNLLRNLQAVKDRHGDEVEICISDNHSSDETAELIAQARERLALRAVEQPRNIGGTLNMIAVVQIASGRWNILVGDDDELLADGFAELLAHLKTAAPEDWVLVGVANAAGRAHPIGGLRPGRYGAAAFRRVLLRKSLYPFGFMGCHVFPASARRSWAELTLAQAQPWPHIAAMLRAMDRGQVQVFETPVMIQAQGGAKLFWNATDLAQITLAKLRILAEADRQMPQHRVFHRLAMLRELYSAPNLGLLLAWKLYEPASYRQTALGSYLEGYRRTGPVLPAVLPHLLLVLLLRAVPHAALCNALRLVGKRHYLTRYAARKQELKAFDGIQRGI